MDFFANIAAKGVGGRQELLVENKPRKHERLFLPLEKSEGATSTEPIYEGELSEIIEAIVPEYVGGALHAAVCEAAAAECAARRCAMNSANKNAEEMIGTLVLKFNRARQAVITQEITEIVSGAEAL